MALVTRIRVTHNTEKQNGAFGGQSRNKRPISRGAANSRHVRCKCTFSLILITIIAIIAVSGGGALSIASYNSGRIMGLENNKAKPASVRANNEMSGSDQSKFVLLYNMRYLGPIIMGIGWFALIVSAVVAYQDDKDKSHTDEGSGGGYKLLSGDVYERGVQLFKMKQAQQNEIQADEAMMPPTSRTSRRSSYRTDSSRLGVGGGGPTERRRSSSFQSIDAAIFKLGSILIPSTMFNRRPSDSPSYNLKEGGLKLKSGDSSPAVSDDESTMSDMSIPIRAPNPTIPAHHVITMRVGNNGAAASSRREKKKGKSAGKEKNTGRVNNAGKEEIAANTNNEVDDPTAESSESESSEHLTSTTAVTSASSKTETLRKTLTEISE